VAKFEVHPSGDALDAQVMIVNAEMSEKDHRRIRYQGTIRDALRHFCFAMEELDEWRANYPEKMMEMAGGTVKWEEIETE